MNPKIQVEAGGWWRDPALRRRMILAGLWTGILVGLYAFRAVLLPFVGAFLCAYLLEPVVRWLRRFTVRGRRLPRYAAILLIYTALFGALYVFAVTAVPRLYREAQRLSVSAQAFLGELDEADLDRQVARVEGWLVEHGFALEPGPVPPPEAPAALRLELSELARDGVRRISDTLRSGVFEVVAFVQRVAGAVVGGIFHFGLLLMLTAFVSIDVDRIRRVLLSLIPHGYQDDAANLLLRIDAGLSGVVRGQLTIMVINGVLTFVGLALFGVKFAVLLALLATVFYVVPIFGTILSSVPIVAVALTDSVEKALAITAWIVGIHMLEAYYLNPKILGDASRIHPVLIVFALLAGEHVGGVVGALLAVPAMSVAVAVFRFVHRRAVELGALPPLQPAKGAASD